MKDDITSLKETIKRLYEHKTALQTQRAQIVESLREIEEQIAAAETLLRKLQGLPPLKKRKRQLGTNADVLCEKLREAEPHGLLVRELVTILKQDGHRLGRARNPSKATSNELTVMRKDNLVYKDSETGRYRIARGIR